MSRTTSKRYALNVGTNLGRMNLNTLSKIGLVVIAAGLSWIIGSEGAD